MKNKNIELLTSFFNRLLAGESLDSVKDDLSQDNTSIEAKDILKVEEALIIEGVPIEEIQKISLFYSDLFSEKLEEVELDREEDSFPKGHPFTIMKNENEFLNTTFQELKEKLKAKNQVGIEEVLKKFKKIKFHYEKKSDLIYPLLKKDYGYFSPSSIMWGVDDEIRDDFRLLEKKGKDLADIKELLSTLISKGEAMLFSERYILAPVCVKEFSTIDWMRIYYELGAYEYILDGKFPIWSEAEERREELKTIGGKITCEIDVSKEKIKATDYITIGSGMMTPQQIDEVFNKIPMEITFVDEKNINRYFDKGKDKIFKRPTMSIGRDMFSCHPAKLLPIVRDIILDFRTGKKDSVNVWMEKNGEPVIVMYMAVRDEEGNYLGTLECVQRLGFAFDRFEKMKS